MKLTTALRTHIHLHKNVKIFIAPWAKSDQTTLEQQDKRGLPFSLLRYKSKERFLDAGKRVESNSHLNLSHLGVRLANQNSPEKLQYKINAH